MSSTRPLLCFLAAVLLAICAPWHLLAQAPLGDEFSLSATRALDQEHPIVCTDGRGRVFAAWNAAYESRIWGRSFAIGGQPLTGDLLIGTLEGESGFEPTCTLDFRGSGAVLWGVAGLAPYSVVGRLLEGAQPLETPALELAPASDGDLPSITHTDDGGFVAAWTKFPLEGPIEIVLQRLDSQGVPIGPTQAVASGLLFGGYGRNFARIAPLQSGAVAVTWAGWTPEGDGYDVWVQVFSASLAPLTLPALVSDTTANDQYDPAIASNGRDRFVVAWDSVEQDGSGDGVFGRLFDAVGVPIGPEFQVSSSAPSSQWDPAVAMDQAGNFAVAFASVQEGIDYRDDVFLRLFDSAGQPVGGQQLVNQQVPYEQKRPSVALSEAGHLLVAWQSEQYRGEPFLDEDAMARSYVLPCLPNEHTLCLHGGRFIVRAFWKIFDGATGIGHALPLADESGGFWFFGPDNFELLVKVLDGCGVNGNYWLFAAGLTDVEVDLLVTDSWTGATQSYTNVLGQPYAPIQEVGRFPGCTATNPHAPALAIGQSKIAESNRSAIPRGLTSTQGASPATAADSCITGGAVLCLGSGRFRATANWQDFEGNVGAAVPVQRGADSGLFWFFWPENVEIALKVLDGCGVNQRYWVYTSGLTNVAVTIRVEDLQTSTVWSYSNPLGRPFPPVLDSSALSVCP